MGLTHINAYRKFPGVNIVAVCDAVRQPVNGVLAGVAGNVAGSDTVDLGTSVRAYQRSRGPARGRRGGPGRPVRADAAARAADPGGVAGGQTRDLREATGRDVGQSREIVDAARRPARFSCRRCACGSGPGGPG